MTKNEQEVFNIAFAIDKNYIDFVGVSIYSIIKNNSDKNIHFHLFITGIDEVNVNLLKELSNNNIKITLYYLNTIFFNNLPICGHFSTGIYYRLAIPNVLKNLKRVLYLDSDIICLGSLSELFKTELSPEQAIAVVEDYIMNPSYLEKIGLSKDSIYFNSGVILIDIQKWIELEPFDYIMNMIHKNNYNYPDQDALNIIFKDKKKILPTHFNWISWNVSPNELTLKNKDISLVHFVGEIKPWHEMIDNEVYDFYKEQSPWRKIPKLPPQNTKQFRKFSKAFYKKMKLIKAIKYQSLYFIRKIKRI